MFVNNEITNRGLLHKLLRAEARLVTPDERALWAHSIESALEDAPRPSTIMRLQLTRPDVVAAAAPALSAVAAALRDDHVVVSREVLDAVRRFMTDGAASPFYGRDPLAARRAAEALRNLFVMARAAEPSRVLAHA